MARTELGPVQAHAGAVSRWVPNFSYRPLHISQFAVTLQVRYTNRYFMYYSHNSAGAVMKRGDLGNICYADAVTLTRYS